MNRKAPISAALATVLTMIFAIGCVCAKKTDSWTIEGRLNGVVYNMNTGFFDATVDCEDGYRVVFTTTKDVAYYLADHKEEPLEVHARWYKCRQLRWIPEVSITAVVATKPKRECRPCWWRTEKFGC